MTTSQALDKALERPFVIIPESGRPDQALAYSPTERIAILFEFDPETLGVYPVLIRDFFNDPDISDDDLFNYAGAFDEAGLFDRVREALLA